MDFLSILQTGLAAAAATAATAAPLPLPPLPSLPARRHLWPDSCAIPPSLCTTPMAFGKSGALTAAKAAAIPELNFDGRTDRRIRFGGSCARCGLPLKKRKEGEGGWEWRSFIFALSRSSFNDFSGNCHQIGVGRGANDDEAPHLCRSCERAVGLLSCSRFGARSLPRLWFSGPAIPILR